MDHARWLTPSQLVDAADKARDNRTFRNYLFLLGLSVTHEFVHLFVGFMYGDEGLNTPPPVHHPPAGRMSQRPGESGRWWEWNFFGAMITHFAQQGNTSPTQPGVFYAMVENSRAWEVDPEWIDSMVNLRT